MGHFAKLDEQNVVTDIIVVNNETLNELPFPESEPVGIAFLTAWSNGHSNWKQTSYNSNFRKRYAAVGGTYEPSLDAFVSAKPFPSWVLDIETCAWQPPTPYPNDGKVYYWNEETLSWVEIPPTE